MLRRSVRFLIQVMLGSVDPKAILATRGELSAIPTSPARQPSTRTVAITIWRTQPTPNARGSILFQSHFVSRSQEVSYFDQERDGRLRSPFIRANQRASIRFGPRKTTKPTIAEKTPAETRS